MEKENKRHTLKVIGRAAGYWRREIGVKQLEIATELGTSLTNISAFERGANDSAIILLWYLLNGFDPLESEEVWQLLNS